MKQVVWLVDAHNVIFANPEYWGFTEEDTAFSRQRLEHVLMNVSRYKSIQIIVVFDGAFSPIRVDESRGIDGFRVIYTGKNETADTCIEELVGSYDSRYYDCFVITSDAAEQKQIFGSGAYRMPVREFLNELEQIQYTQGGEVEDLYRLSARHQLGDRLEGGAVEHLEQLRRKK